MPKPEKMIGLTWMYRTEEYRILDIKRKDRKTFTVTTNKGELVVSEHNLRKDFFPTEPDPPKGGIVKPAVTYTNVATLKALIADELKPVGTLADLLIENMKTLKTDKSFIPQAKAMNEQAKSIIAIAKLKLDAVRLFRKGGQS